MRIPYPERISYTSATVAASILLVVQLVEHTDPLFALLCFVYILLATMAFNLAGGLYRPAGAFICFNAVLTLLVGLLAKAFLGEPANSHLLSPTRILEVYVAGMVSMLIAAFLEKSFRPKHSLIARTLPSDSLRAVYLGAAFIGIAFNMYLLTGPDIAPGSVMGILRTSNVFLPFAIIVGVIYTVQSSNGTRSLTPLIAIIMFISTALGYVGFTKLGMFTPTFCWALGAGIARYKLKQRDFIVLAGALFFLFYTGVPISQAGKNIHSGNRVFIVVNMIMNIQKIRADVARTSQSDYGKINYYDHPEGFLDRLQMISIDDLIVTQTDHDGFYGYLPFIEGWENVIPHFIWKNKPVPYFGNAYAHKIGIIPDNDFTTGISFSPTADAYVEGGFTGILVMETFCLTAVFMVMSYVGGDIREHPAVMLLLLIAAHSAPEGMIAGLIQLIVYVFVVVEFAIFCRYIAPVASSALVPTVPGRLPDMASAID